MLSLEDFKTSLTLPSPVEPFFPKWKGAEKVSLFVKRDDAIHPIMSGNKWRKLSNALPPSLPKAIVSFGGGFSNHLHALGFICFKLGIPFTAIIRGDYSATPSPMIKDLIQWQTHIEYVDRITYKKRSDSAYLNELKLQFPDAIIIPEGGSQAQALQGIKDLVDEIEVDFDFIVAPVASGATLAGIINALNKRNRTTATDFRSLHKVIGIGVLKGEGYLEGLVQKFLPISKHQTSWHIDHNYHFGGYAKAPNELQTFCNDFNDNMEFKIEPVYSGKAFWAVKDMLAKGKFEDRSRIVVLHTGGLQGAR
ncbi:1-aminocyclopropane-1-carboxylate deaminase/D-cysteine desulfhydrase [Alteromonas mediterranea]|uniref:D-cysteine desulfhydrase n=1 Tax=Alteromonas mediterranea (strain DSM 17117 / CIP 110805 / LMG 28347 / Deep ecotype) TaxID=1774373 RepID=F2GDA8_ALTMD|nr:pyridoxal-phosphate dependent enzyme [Alteromonas mediterranea]AEA99244.1 D-cysteine desulfhydrase [Alteromonas mediterranea DE]CAH1208275.1 1-aminocyclopropane-1-carboxylate deaminase [Alteromonas mediterranea]